jgi:hypothetical protein
MNTVTEVVVYTVIAVLVGVAVYTVAHVILKII